MEYVHSVSGKTSDFWLPWNVPFFFKKKISLLPCPVVTIGRLEIIKRVNDMYVICTHKCVTGYGF